MDCRSFAGFHGFVAHVACLRARPNKIVLFIRRLDVTITILPIHERKEHALNGQKSLKDRRKAVNRVISNMKCFSQAEQTDSEGQILRFFIISVTGRTPGGFNRLDIPSSRAYFLGTPTNQNLLPNFIGCIRDFIVDGYEPITNAWARKPDYNIVRRGSMRLCSSSDETR